MLNIPLPQKTVQMWLEMAVNGGQIYGTYMYEQAFPFF